MSDTGSNNAAAAQRLHRVAQLTAEYLRALSPAERDRIMQTHLAQAREPSTNLKSVCQLTRSVLELRKNRAGDGKPTD